MKYVYSLLSIYGIWFVTAFLLGSKNPLVLSTWVALGIFTFISLLPIYLLKRKENKVLYYIWTIITTLFGEFFIFLCKFVIGDHTETHANNVVHHHKWDDEMFVGVIFFSSMLQLLLSLIFFIVGLFSGKKEMNELMETTFEEKPEEK